tara:strand:+ start:2797 stop:3885 length:1089 start_codon:yes stop_codon:yes gene_type:complete
MKSREKSNGISKAWEPLNNKARKYYELTQPLLEQGEGKIYFESGRDPDTKEVFKYEIDSRSEEQKVLAVEIVEDSYPYLRKIAGDLLNSTKAVNSKGERRVLSLKDLRGRLEVDELVTEGALGLMRGLHNHDPSEGSISTFINYNAVFKMHRYASHRFPGVIDIPLHIVSDARKIMVGTSRKNVIKALKRKFNTSEYRAGIIYESMSGEHKSIDERIGGRNSSLSSLKLEETLSDESPKSNVKYQAEMALLKDSVGEVLHTLTEKEEKTIRLRFGLDDGYPRMLEEVGIVFNVTQERVRQIEAKALRKLRHPRWANNLALFAGKGKTVEKIIRDHRYYQREDIGSQTIEPWEIADGIKVIGK